MEKIEIENYPMVSPTPIVIIGTNVDHKENYTTVGAFGVVCLAPLFYVSLKSTHYAVKGIEQTGSFSVNLPSVGMMKKTDYCGMVSGQATDKSNVFSSFYDERGNAPMIREAPMNYLCKVVQTTAVRDFEIFFGEIVATYVNNEYIVDGKPDPLKINPILGMGPTYYTLGQPVGEMFREGSDLYE